MFDALRSARWLVNALFMMIVSVSCGDTGSTEVAPGGDAANTTTATSKSEASMTPALRAAYIAAVQADAGETFHAEREVSGAARFVHLTQGFEVTVDGAEVRLMPANAAAWEVLLSTSRIDCEGAVERRVGAGNLEMAGNRVEIVRPEVREWYMNGPLGLEQGFTLEHAPSCEGTKVVSIDVGGSMIPELVDADGDGRGDAITFVDAQGVSLLRYTDLYVQDATGKRLDAWMSVTVNGLSLHVNDAGATYPVRIDPLIAVQQAQLIASDGVSVDFFGRSVALSGDTALVGAFQDDVMLPDQGSAYVFTRSGAVWTQQAKLTASDGAANDKFGISVALSGDTALVGAYLDDVGVIFPRFRGQWDYAANAFTCVRNSNSTGLR